MNVINIFDRKDKLSYNFYDDEVMNFSNTISDYRLDDILDEISELDIIFTSMRKDVNNCDNLCVKYSNFNVILYDMETLCEKHSDKLDKYMSKIINFEAQKNINEVKNSKKSEQAPKVERKNKHTKCAIGLTGAVMAFMITLGVHSCDIKNTDKNSVPDLNIPGVSDENILPSWSTSSPSFEVVTPTPTKSPIDIIIPDVEEETDQKDDEESQIPYIEIGYEDLSQTEKAIRTRELYGDIIDKYSKMYGLDTDLMIAIATQERGIHSSVMDKGGGIGLMQIQNSVWLDETIKAYNYETKQYDSLLITKDNIGDLETNIKIGCMHAQECIERSKGNILLSLQMYNFGTRNIKKVINAYSEDTGKNIEDIYANQNDIDWLEYTDVVSAGDKSYVSHVLSWLGPYKEIKLLTKDEGEHSIIVGNGMVKENTVSMSR